MIRVQVRPNETLEAALRRFKRQCNYAGIFRLAKKYAHHEKRSDKRRREERERIRNIQRAMRKANVKTKVRSPKRSKVRRPEEDIHDADNPMVDVPKTNSIRPSTSFSVSAPRAAHVAHKPEPAIAKVDGDHGAPAGEV